MNKKLSILIYSLASGGAERVVSILLNELQDNYDITLVLMNNTIFYDFPKNISIKYLESSNPQEHGIKKLLKLPLLAYKYYKFCKNSNIDISLSFMNRPNYINVLSKIIGNKSKIIINERAMPSIQHRDGIQGLINRLLIKILYNKSDIILSNSKGNSFDLVNSFSIKQPIVINNPINIGITRKLSLENMQLKKDKVIFVTIGRLDKGKNHKLLIDAFVGINAYLYIIGDGILREELESRIQNLKLQNNVFLVGRQSNPYKYLNNSDCFLFSSNHEGFPNVLLEALACGLPVISTDCMSGPREILGPSTSSSLNLINKIELVEYGILVPTGNILRMQEAIKLIITKQDLRRKFRLRAEQRIQDFTTKKITQQYKEVLCAE